MGFFLDGPKSPLGVLCNLSQLRHRPSFWSKLHWVQLVECWVMQIIFRIFYLVFASHSLSYVYWSVK